MSSVKTDDLAFIFNDILPNHVELSPFFEAVHYYDILCKDKAGRLTGKDEKRELEKFERQVSKLRNTLYNLSIGSTERMIHAQVIAGGPKKVELIEMLRHLEDQIEVSLRANQRESKLGAGYRPTSFLVRNVADALVQAGLVADTRSTGYLHKIIKAIFENRDEWHSKIDIMIDTALKNKA